MDGFYGRILKINLTEKKYAIEKIDDEILASYPGAKGLGSFLLWKLNPENVDPLSPENRIIFATGPVCHSMIWGSSRYGVFTKSPQTGIFSESYAGGKTPEAVDSAGFDAIVISGKSSVPTVLLVHPKGATFKNADDIWGMETYAAEDAVNARFAGPKEKGEKTGAVVIGPAGENLVRFACIENDYWRSAGRTGVGAVMGSKKLKAILFSGNMKRPLHDPEAVKAFSKQTASESKKSTGVLEFTRHGTPKMLNQVIKIGAFPSRFWTPGDFPDWEKLSAQALHQTCDVTPRACARCFIACGRMTKVLEGRHAGLKMEGPEYETIFSFGGLCLITSIEEVIHLNDLCDRLGMDTISSGNLCGFAIEARKRGKIDFDISYGDPVGVARLLEMIALRKGIGDVLAKGMRFAAAQWGMEDMAVHVKGLELPGYDPRVLKGSALAFAVSNRGACHLRASFHSSEISGAIPRNEIKGKAALLIDAEDRLTVMDCMILCRFYKDIYTWDKMALIFKMITGMDWDKTTLQKKAANIADMIRRLNVREGLLPSDDALPERLYKERLKNGGGISRQELEYMVKDYYFHRGWDENGNPDSPPTI